jgi:hypothetical protein
MPFHQMHTMKQPSSSALIADTDFPYPHELAKAAAGAVYRFATP